MTYRYTALEQIKLRNICGYHDSRDQQENGTSESPDSPKRRLDLVRRFQIKASRSPMQLIGFSFTREKSEFSHLCPPTHFALRMPLVVLSRRRLTVSSELRLLNDLFCRLSGGVPKGYRAIRVGVCTSKSSRSRHSVRHAFRPAVERLLDFRKEELLGGWIRLGERRPIEIAKVCETISLIHSALSSRRTNELST